MDEAELYEHWQSNKDRPAWVLEHRDEIHEHTDTDDPVPTSGMFDVRQWLDSYKGVVTRQLTPEDGETPTADDDEGGN